MHTPPSHRREAGGFRPGLYLSIENPPFLALVVKALDESGFSVFRNLRRALWETERRPLARLGDVLRNGETPRRNTLTIGAIIMWPSNASRTFSRALLKMEHGTSMDHLSSLNY
jgi:hypothetical protein